MQNKRSVNKRHSTHFISLTELKKHGKIIKTIDDVIPNSLKKIQKEQSELNSEILTKLIKQRFIPLV